MAGYQEKVPVPGRGERITGRGWASGESPCSGTGEESRELAEAGHQEKVPVPGRGERTTGRGLTSGERTVCIRRKFPFLEEDNRELA